MGHHRNRQYSPTMTLSMFVHQVLSEDSSCQNAANNLNVGRIKAGTEKFSSHTRAYCMARQRLPLQMIADLVKESGKQLTKMA